MNLDTAKEIVRIQCTTRRLIEAIKLFRYETGFGLIAAKQYLEDYRPGDEDALLKKLCADFVKDKKDILIEARAELVRQMKIVDNLEREIALEGETSND